MGNTETPTPNRLTSVDLLRGVVMVIMALDHVRDYFLQPRIDISDPLRIVDPTDLSRTTAALFFTRWVTHFCAPVFVFLAGVGSGLSRARGKPRGELAWFLITRGAFLILLEGTLVHIGWEFNLRYAIGVRFGVIWVIGASMIILAGLVYLPRIVIGVIALAMIAGHNAFDGVKPEAFGAFADVWRVLHTGGIIPVLGVKFAVGYPLIPWVGVMAAGYAFAPVLLLPNRRSPLLLLGVLTCTAFTMIRLENLYGDPRPWVSQPSGAFTIVSFLNTWKYPPSLLYLLMTLGPALIALAVFDGLNDIVSRFFITIGRVPLFFYLSHLYLIHGLAIVAGAWLGYDFGRFFVVWDEFPVGYGFSLAGVYIAWIVVVALLYPPCLLFAGAKHRSKSVWLSYL